jgi:mannose-6-phosphate isomerase-like protein (cupin superfamily)
VIHLANAQARIPGPAGEHAVGVMQRGALDVKLSMPRPPNRQAPHAQDEIYVIVRGRGVLVTNGGREPFGPGDDIAVWVIFHGPPGGEVPRQG